MSDPAADARAAVALAKSPGGRELTARAKRAKSYLSQRARQRADAKRPIREGRYSWGGADGVQHVDRRADEREGQLTEAIGKVEDFYVLPLEPPRRDTFQDFGPDAPAVNRLREAREAAHLDREQLADAARVPLAIVERVEDEAWRPPDGIRAVLAAALGEREAELFEGGPTE